LILNVLLVLPFIEKYFRTNKTAHGRNRSELDLIEHTQNHPESERMIKDQLFKRLFIPLTGLLFPFVAGLVTSQTTLFPNLLFGAVFFIGVVFVVWNGVVKLASYLRLLPTLKTAIFLKLVTLVLASAMYAAGICFLSSLLWTRLNVHDDNSGQVWRATLVGGVGGALLALMYEAVFLSVEKDLDTKVLQQIDKERLAAEVNVLRNELDPHFFFNCMNALSHLVREDKNKAYEFVHKLSNIYKYFLRNKDVDFVPLQDEMAFLDNYCYLLSIRFENNIRIENTIELPDETVYIIPCTLQVLVENAIKHNFFSEKEPLQVSIAMNDYFITVSNYIKPKPHKDESTKVGLRNLKARYRLITNQNVLVQKGSSRFLVKLPIIKQISYDKNSDH